MTIKTVKACLGLTYKGVSLLLICQNIKITWMVFTPAEKTCHVRLAGCCPEVEGEGVECDFDPMKNTAVAILVELTPNS